MKNKGAVQIKVLRKGVEISILNGVPYRVSVFYQDGLLNEAICQPHSLWRVQLPQSVLDAIASRDEGLVIVASPVFP